MAEIQAQGGVTFARDENTVRYDRMPQSVIASRFAGYVLPPKGFAQELSRIAKHPLVARPDSHSAAQLVSSDGSGMDAIFPLLRRNTGVDFTHYRQTTILRRIQRRMRESCGSDGAKEDTEVSTD